MLILLMPSVIVECLQVNNVPGGVCDYLYGRDVDGTGKFCAGGSVDACQVTISADDHGVMSLVTGDSSTCNVALSINQDVSPSQSRLTDMESLAVISHKD